MNVRGITLFIVALLAAIFLAITDPTMDDFHAHLTAELQHKTAESAKTDAASAAMSRLANWFATEYGMQQARRQDYVVFSLYSAEIDGQTQRWVGIVKQFVPIP
ncbi:MAG TPA: hypothetical protein VGK74_13575 [Symbiobacteriaceae bacterium]|jgi:hypothetical protein